MSGLDALLAPRSVAVVGASDDPARTGGRPLHYLLTGGFEGRIVAVNPHRDRVQGLTAVPSLREAGPVDCAILAVSAERTPAALQDAAATGVRAAVIFSAGFGEAGSEGSLRQAEIAAIARQSGIRLLGPNCLGLYNLRSRAFLTMTALFQDGFPASGDLGVVSQSGGYAGQLAYLARQRGIGIGAWVTTGNEADVDLAEVLMAYAGDPGIRTVLAYIEGVKSGPRFVAALDALRRAGKPLIVFKVGSSATGAAAVSSHTAAMAGEDAIYDALFREFGAARVSSTEAALDIAYAAQFGRPAGRRFAAVSTSGGIGGQLADLAEAAGLAMPPTPLPLAATLAGIAPLGSARNPVDVSGQVVNDPSIMGRSVAALVASGSYDILHAFIGFSAGTGWLADSYRTTMTEAARSSDCRLIATISGPPDLIASYERAGYAVFEEPARGVAALAALAGMTGEDPAAPAPPVLGDTRDATLLAAAGIALPARRLVPTAAEAGAAAHEIGGKLVLKIVSPDIAHKTDVGGVALDLTAGGVAAAASAMWATVTTRRPEARLTGFEIAEMLPAELDLILAWHSDPVFGKIISFGLGGVLVEVMADTVLHRAPVSETAARGMIDRLQMRRLFDGYRGTPAADLPALAGLIARFSQVALAAEDVETFEINPLRLTGKGPVALDVLAGRTA